MSWPFFTVLPYSRLLSARYYREISFVAAVITVFTDHVVWMCLSSFIRWFLIAACWQVEFNVLVWCDWAEFDSKLSVWCKISHYWVKACDFVRQETNVTTLPCFFALRGCILYTISMIYNILVLMKYLHKSLICGHTLRSPNVWLWRFRISGAVARKRGLIEKNIRDAGICVTLSMFMVNL